MGTFSVPLHSSTGPANHAPPVRGSPRWSPAGLDTRRGSFFGRWGWPRSSFIFVNHIGLRLRHAIFGASVGVDLMIVPDGDVEALALHMLKTFPADAADRAAFRSNAFFVLGRRKTSEKWLRISEEITKLQAGQI